MDNLSQTLNTRQDSLCGNGGVAQAEEVKGRIVFENKGLMGQINIKSPDKGLYLFEMIKR